MTAPILDRLPHARCVSAREAQAARWRERPGARTVHFLRHGEAEHERRAAAEALRGVVCRCDEFEAAGRTPGACPYWDPVLVDSELTDTGRRQVGGLGANLGAECVYSAASLRALESALLAFPGRSGPAQDPRRPPIVALEELRARTGAHMHSRRRSLGEHRRRFPEVDFGRISSEDDLLWSPQTESRALLDARAARFVRILFAQPKQTVAVVTHFTLLLSLLLPAAETVVIGRNPLRPENDPAMLDGREAEDPAGLRAFLAIGEIRSLVLLPDSEDA